LTKQFKTPTGEQMPLRDTMNNPSWPKVKDLWVHDNYNTKIKTGFKASNSNDMSI